MQRRLRVLLVMEQCNPDLASVPLVAWHVQEALREFVDVTLVTHERNRDAFEARQVPVEIVPESQMVRTWYRAVVDPIGRRIWPLYHTLNFPIYAEFDRRAWRLCKERLFNGAFDLVHVMTPMMPRYPSRMAAAAGRVPLVIGPVNGGIPFPPGFNKVARAEHSHLNFLRALGRMLIPNYRRTYRSAAAVLAGSTYTLQMVREMFDLPAERMHLVCENGVSKAFLVEAAARRAAAIRFDSDPSRLLRLLFVGRLVPYKGADMLLDAISALPEALRKRTQLTIVGDGQERGRLEAMASAPPLRGRVKFTGWIPQQATAEHYSAADLFCFPSVREFGGAVVLEAMACGLPCIVADHGGIGEYVNANCGVKLPPTDRITLVNGLRDAIEALAADPARLESLGHGARQRAAQFSWQNKAREIEQIYRHVLTNRIPDERA